MNILAGQDGSDASLHAIGSVIDLAAHYREEGDPALAAVSELFAAARIAVKRRMRLGAAAQTIVRLAGELDRELICLGTHGRGALSTPLLGSAAGKAVHLSSVPATLVKRTSKSTP